MASEAPEADAMTSWDTTMELFFCSAGLCDVASEKPQADAMMRWEMMMEFSFVLQGLAM